MKLRIFGPAAWACLAVVFYALPVSAGNCLSEGCHRNLTNRKHLHGPVAMEMANGKGCVACHIPDGPPCAKGVAGKFSMDKTKICGKCHAKGTGTQHSVETPNCLSCHDPHGSDISRELLLEGAGK